MIRTLWVYLAGSAFTVYYGTNVALRTALRWPNPESWAESIMRNWSRCILWAAGVRVEMEGAENISKEGVQVLVGNHESWFDVWVLCVHIPTRFLFVAKKELKKVPFFGKAWQRCGHISIDRGDHGSAVESLFRAAAEIRQTGASIMMFPEGTRTDDGELQRFKKGAFVLAIQAEAPVVPIGLSGSRAIMAKGSRRIRSGTVRVRIGEPLAVSGLTHEDRDALSLRARQAIELLRGPAASGTLAGEGDAAP